jgi:hypothetical protein
MGNSLGIGKVDKPRGEVGIVRLEAHADGGRTTVTALGSGIFQVNPSIRGFGFAQPLLRMSANVRVTTPLILSRD